MLAVVAEAEARGIASRTGFGTTSRMLSAMLRVSAAEARTRTEHAAMVSTRRAITGEVLPARLPATAAALAEGQIGTGQLKVITETMVLLPASVPEPAREHIEADLAGYARDFDPRRLRIIAQRMLDVLDPDGREPAEDPTPVTPAGGELWLKDRRDGRLGLEGWLDAEHGSMVRALIEQLATLRPATEGVADDRSVPQRQADALVELCERARAAEELPTTAGEPPHVTVTIDWDTLRTGVDDEGWPELDASAVDGDVPALEVDLLVAHRAQQATILYRRHAIISPEHDVMRGAESGWPITAGERTPAISDDQGAADTQRDAALGTAHIQGLTVTAEHHGNQLAVTRDAPGGRGADQLPVVQSRGAQSDQY